MDFFKIKERVKNGVLEIYPDFKICRSKDLMVRGKSFYAIWDEEKGLWSTDEYDVQRIVDAELLTHKEKIQHKADRIVVKLMSDFSTKSWSEFRSYMNHVSDNSNQLDIKLMFANTEIKKKDYASKRLSYPLEGGTIDAYEELIQTLYEDKEREKLEWAIGAILSGDAKDIQKFIVLYGEAGTGKSTILNIIQKLFEGYYTTFDAKTLTSSSNAFATEVFKCNPLVAIQHDGDLSKIEDNTKLNSIVSHEEMTMNEKYKPSYSARINCFLFMGTNKPVKITDAKSGIIRRLIDVKPTGVKLPAKRYQVLMSQIEFELGAIAHHCLELYRELGKNYYADYRPLDMIYQTDIFFNYVESNYHVFKEQDGASLSQAYDLYKVYCEDALIEHKIAKYKFREELKNYFKDFTEVARINGAQVRSWYSGFLDGKFQSISKTIDEEHQSPLILDKVNSIFDDLYKDCPAQYASIKETPSKKWETVTTKLGDIKTNKLHYVKPPENHIVIDFDLKDSSGNKSLELNIEAASKWLPTYTEYSKSGAGIHLHYIYSGDVNTLSRIYSEGIEIKVFNGNSSLRRKLSKCNNIPIATINSGLPLKGEKMINFDSVKSEKGLRELIKRNLKKEIHGGTKPSIDFIHKILEDAYDSGITYDLTDMRPAVLTFGSNSSNQADYCLKLVSVMKFKSEETSLAIYEPAKEGVVIDTEFVFFDVEVFPNLFVVVWKKLGGVPVKMINPAPHEIEALFKFLLIGFNCRRYDNHILYARYIGYNNDQLYKLSQRIINNSPNCMFGEAYNISHTDVYDYSSRKQSLKKWEIELGIHHQELGLPWDQPVPSELWGKVADYCVNDVVATEVVFLHTKEDWSARLILSKLSGLTPNDSTQNHAAKIIFGKDRKPQEKFIYTDLSIMFPGYKYELGVSTYRGEKVGEGGKVYAEPGIHLNVALLDVTSMHPYSLILLKAFGIYTQRFEEIVEARVAVKDKEFTKAKKMLDGILAPYLENVDGSDELAYSLKLIINIIYGMTSAKFDNMFKDPRNVDNIVAKRGALFMIDLKHAVQEKGFTVAHIKTDSIKIPNATKEIIEFVNDFGAKYGYKFKHEATYEKMCLVNDAVYIAKYGWSEKEKLIGTWTATGAQFAQPYVYKTLFTKESLKFEDLCETKSVSTALYIDMNEGLKDVSIFEKVKEMRSNPDKKYSNNDMNTLNAWKSLSDSELDLRISEGHDYHFVGKVGLFCPISPNRGGGVLLREKDGIYHAATGTKGYRWLEAEMVKTLGKENDIDHNYYRGLVDDAIANISKYGDFESFVSDDKDHPPWESPCGGSDLEKNCFDCPEFDVGLDTKCKKGYNILPF